MQKQAPSQIHFRIRGKAACYGEMDVAIELSAEQRAAIEFVRSRRVSVIQGGPGTGKTTIIRHLDFGGERVLLCAPTGNAADRLSKATGGAAHVLAKVLHDADAIEANRGLCNLVLDEASMLSVSTVRQAIRALKPRRLVFVGDVHQLPCTEGFSVLSALVYTPGAPVVNLHRNHRSAEAPTLLRVLAAVGDPSKRADLGLHDASFRVVHFATREQVLRGAAELYRTAVDNGGSQMLAFTKANCDELNRLTADCGELEVAAGVRVGDRVVCTRNLYEKGTKTLSVANGMLGEVLSKNVVSYENGFDDTRRVGGKFASSFAPARAMTVHKSQGNEFSGLGVVVVGGWKSPPAEIVYTALSRFKQRVVVVGTKEDVREAFVASFCPAVDANLSSKLRGIFARADQGGS